MDNATKKDAYSDMVAAATSAASKKKTITLIYENVEHEIRLGPAAKDGRRQVKIYLDYYSILDGTVRPLKVTEAIWTGEDLANWYGSEPFYNAVKGAIEKCTS